MISNDPQGWTRYPDGTYAPPSVSNHDHPPRLILPGDLSSTLYGGTPTAVTGTAGATGTQTALARGDHSHQYNPPSCRVYHDAVQGLSNNTETTLSFNQERYKTHSAMHSNVTDNSRIYMPWAGVYDLFAQVQFTPDAGGDIVAAYVTIQANIAGVGQFHILTATSGVWTAIAFGPHFTVSGQYKFAAGDYAFVRALHVNSSGGVNNIPASNRNGCEFGATWIGVG